MPTIYSIHRFKNLYKSNGFIGTIRYILQSYLGINRQREEIETLRYFFKKYHKLSDIHETEDGELRILQKCDTMLLGIFDKLCNRYNLTYWCDHGTLLGAVRHNGFIPWDDDTDLAMPRGDLNKAVDILKKEMNPMGISIEFYEGEKLNRICVHFQHKKTGTWIDVFPMDEIASTLNHDEIKQKIEPLIIKYSRYYRMNHTIKKDKDLWNKKRNLIYNKIEEGNNLYLFHGGEHPQPNVRLFEKKWIFPLQRKVFENVELNVPANADQYLKETYGEDYMDFPKTGVEHHGIGREPLQKWYKHSNIDMYELYNKLQDFYIKL